MADITPENTTVVEAENVIVAENTPSQEALADAEARAERAEEIAEDIADAALRTAQGAEIQDIKEDLAECQTEQSKQESEAEAARRRIGALEAGQGEILTRLDTLAQTLTGSLEAIQARLIPLLPDPTPTPEPAPTTAEPDPGAAVPEAPAAPRRKLFRLI